MLFNGTCRVTSSTTHSFPSVPFYTAERKLLELFLWSYSQWFLFHISFGPVTTPSPIFTKLTGKRHKDVESKAKKNFLMSIYKEFIAPGRVTESMTLTSLFGLDIILMELVFSSDGLF